MTECGRKYKTELKTHTPLVYSISSEKCSSLEIQTAHSLGVTQTQTVSIKPAMNVSIKPVDTENPWCRVMGGVKDNVQKSEHP